MTRHTIIWGWLRVVLGMMQTYESRCQCFYAHDGRHPPSYLDSGRGRIECNPYEPPYLQGEV